MEIVKEKAFPRGGRKPALKCRKNLSNSLFKKPKLKTKKNKKKGKKCKDNLEVKNPKVKQFKDPLSVRIVEDLRPSFLQNGMLVLGIVSDVSEKVVNVSLPGHLRGAINLANVSEQYKNIIENVEQNSEVPSLSAIFQIGDVLPVKIISVSTNHHSLLVTTDPKLINQKLSYDIIENGFILTGSVKSVEDHGYIIDFGIDHANGFLNFDKVDSNKNLIIGQLVRCCILSCIKSPGSCNVQLSTLKNDLQSSVIKSDSRLPLYCFIPGFQFEVTIEKTLIEGVEVSYGSDNSLKGCIFQDHLLKKFSNLSEIEPGTQSIATLLYIKPLINLPYFKIMPKKKIVWPFQFGQIVRGKVVKANGSGVFFKIVEGSNKAKCFVPIPKLKSGNKWIENKSALLNLYPVGKIVPKIRLRHVDFMGRCYFGATDRASIQEKYYSISDVKCGDIVSCKILSFKERSARLQIGQTIGFVQFTDMTDVPLGNPASKFTVGQTVQARVTDVIPEKRFIRVTMKPTLLKEKEILCDLENFQKDKRYIGTVFKVLDNKLFVKFFNGIKGVVSKFQTPYADSSSLKENFYEGQLVKCFIVSYEGCKLFLTLLSNRSDAEIEVGKKYKAKVTNKVSGGLFLDIELGKDKKVKGYLPKELLTTHSNLSSAFFSTYSSEDKLVVYCLLKTKKNELPVFGIAEVFDNFYEGKSEKEMQGKLEPNSVLPFLILSKNNKTKSIILQSIIPGRSDWCVKVIRNDLSSFNVVSKYQVIYGKILSIAEEKINVTLKLHDVWDKDFNTSLSFLDSYLKVVDALVKRQKDKLQAYNEELCLGCSVNGVIEDIRKSHAVVRTDLGDLGLVEGKFSKGDKVNGKVVWIDVKDQMIYIKATSKSDDSNKKKANFVPENDNLRGKVAFIEDEVVVIELKGRGSGELAFLPRRRHMNDFIISKCLFAVGDELKVWITKKDSNHLLAMDRQVVDLQEKIIWKKGNSQLKDSIESLKNNLKSEKKEVNKKRKVASSVEDIQVVDVKLANNIVIGKDDSLIEIKEETDVDDDTFNISRNEVPKLEYDDVDIKSEVDDLEKTQSSCMINNDERIIFSSSSDSEVEDESQKTIDNSKAFNIGFNWNVLNNQSLLFGAKLNEKDSSDDDDDDVKHDKKKRRLTASEKREKAKSEEERLRFIEERLMDTTREPETADDFDRAVLSNPNSSVLWLKYMAFHIQGTEIEKARAVARRALKAIPFRQEQEKLNIWIALLNLENLYGNEDSLNKTLSEALQSNDPYKIHLHMLNIDGQSNKLQEMEKLGNFIVKKYKDVENMWYDVGQAYFSVGKVESARNVLQKALTVVDKSQHIRLISKFAQLENKYGSPERAQTLYESILASYPKRVDIWSCYVDMLVKSNHIDLARQVLERATSQNLRPRKMKTLFKKFITFEETHGTPENVEKVREAAVEYVQTVGAAED